MAIVDGQQVVITKGQIELYKQFLLYTRFRNLALNQ